MVECLMLSLAAGVLGLAIGWWGLQALLRMVPAGRRRWPARPSTGA